MAGKGERKQKIVVEELLVTSAVLIAGIALQFFIGGYDKRILAFPVNIILFSSIVLVISLSGRAVLARLSSGSLSVILISIFVIASLWMGLVPGNMVKISWPFALLYLLTIINLTAVIIKRLKTVKVRDISFLLNHIGLLVLLLAAGFGSADKSRYFMRVNEGEVEWRGERSGGEKGVVKELPIAVSLSDFILEEYPPKLALVDRATGEALPLDKPHFMESKVGTKWSYQEIKISVDSFEIHPRLAPKAYVSVAGANENPKIEGWVTCGSYFQHHKTLNINDKLCIAMTFPEPQRFISKVEVYTEDGDIREGEILVNHPMTMGPWKIYQHSYDSHMGRDSQWSVFELVYDPWLYIAYFGIICMMAGALTLFWKGGKL